MKINKTPLLMTVLAASTLFGCASTPEQAETEKTPAEPVVKVNDFPTRDRVEYVLNCVAQHGGLTFITQYACGCKVDKIAEKMTFAEYEAAKTFSMLKSTPGEAGGIFRDPKQSKDLRKQLKDAEAWAEKQCFVK